MKKAELIFHLIAILKEKIALIDASIDSTRNSRDNETKSSAGDKHEVGRAMMDMELEQQQVQRGKIQAQVHELAAVPLDRKFDRASPGSLVVTDHGTYFISIGLGQIELRDRRYFIISPSSPAGVAFVGKKIGETVFFNSKHVKILQIE